MRKKAMTVSAKYVRSLHVEIRRRDEQIAQLQRTVHTSNDKLHAQALAIDTLQTELDAMAAKVERMGKDLGAANAREIATRHVACVALNGLGAIGHGVKVTPSDQVASTAFALERDGRVQLEKAKNGNGGHA